MNYEKVYQKQLPRVVVTMAISKQNIDIEYFIDHSKFNYHSVL